MLTEEKGPGRIFRKIREASGIEYVSNESGEILSYNDYTPLNCIYCTSVWVSLALFITPNWVTRLLAISALAIVLDDVKEYLDGNSNRD